MNTPLPRRAILVNDTPTANTAASRPANQNMGTPQFAYAATHQQPRRIMQ